MINKIFNKLFYKKYYVPYEWHDEKSNKWTGSIELNTLRFFRVNYKELQNNIKQYIIEDTDLVPQDITILSINKL